MPPHSPLASDLAPTQSMSLRLPSFFADGMVIQRDKPPLIWGWAPPGASVCVQLASQARIVAADSTGRWQATFDPLAAGDAPMILSVQSGPYSRSVRNILVGEVWLCAGQSNMAMALHEVNGGNEAACHDSRLRFFATGFSAPDTPSDDCAGEWVVCSPETAAAFSAVAYFFGRELRRELDVPVGLILSAQGATAGECWMSREALAQDPDLAPILRDLRSRIVDPLGWDMHLPSGLFHGRIAPLAPLRLRGFIWYQGETNAKRAWQYRKLFPLLIHDWRRAWGEELPFYFVQLANYLPPPSTPVNESWAELRESQALALRLPHTGMAVAIDVGDENDIHPKNKAPVGYRLAALALARDYGRLTVACGPLYHSMSVEGNRIRITFDFTGSGLVSKNGPLRQFAIAGTDRRFVWADAVIDGTTVIVSSPHIPEPVAVRYAWANNPAGCNLANHEGFPAAPFRTDRWPGVTDCTHLVEPPPRPAITTPLLDLPPPLSSGESGNTLVVDLSATIPRPWEQVVANGYRYGSRQLPEGDGLRIWLPYGPDRGAYYAVAGFNLTPTRPGAPASLVYAGGGDQPASLVLRFAFSGPICAFRLHLGPAQFTAAGARAFVDYSVDENNWTTFQEIPATASPYIPIEQESHLIEIPCTRQLLLRLQVRGEALSRAVPATTRLHIRMGGDVTWGDANVTFAAAQWQLWVSPAPHVD